MAYLGAALALIDDSSDSSISITIPPGATSGPIRIVSGNNEVESPAFTVHDVLVLISDGTLFAIWRNGVITPGSQSSSNPQNGTALAISADGVYVSGYMYTTTVNPTIWKNGVPTILSNTDGIVLDIEVDGNNVHGVGIEMNGVSYAPAYWLNGNRTFLNTPSFDESNDDGSVIKLSNNKVYLGGSMATSSPATVATYWVDLAPVPLTESAGIKDMAIVNNSVHAVGYRSTSLYPKAVYWMDDVYHELSDGTSEVYVEAIAYNGNDVYYVGTARNDQGKMMGCMWKNGVRQYLTGTTSTNSILFAGNDRLILCRLNDSSQTPAIMFNDQLIPISSPNSQPVDMVLRKP